MYRLTCGAPAHPRPTGASSSTPPQLRNPYRPPVNIPYNPRPGLHWASSGTFRPRPPPGPNRPTSGPYRTDTRHAGYGHPYTRQRDTAGPPTPTERRDTRIGTSPLPSGSRRQGSHSQPSTGRKSSCQICSFTQKAPDVKRQVYHDHFSSKNLREILGVEFSLSGSYFCPSCKCRHAPYPTERTKIVLSDSTMHNFFAPPTATRTNYEGDTQHTDYLTISGATLETLFHAFKQEYSHHTKPMDIFIIAGYNNLLRNQGRDVIIDIISKFGEYVRELTNEDESCNTVTVGTLLYPPQLAWFADDGPEPLNYRNQKDKINWINVKIDSLNIEHGREHYVGVHKYGIRVTTKKWLDCDGRQCERHIKKHRWEQWRELDKRNMLHLTNERRFVLGRAVNEYFIHRT